MTKEQTTILTSDLVKIDEILDGLIGGAQALEAGLESPSVDPVMAVRGLRILAQRASEILAEHLS